MFWNTLKVRWQIWMTAKSNVRKMYRTVERIDGSEYSTEVIIIPLKEHTTETNTLEINTLLLKELIKQWIFLFF